MQKTILYTVFAAFLLAAACKKINYNPSWQGPLQQKAMAWLDKKAARQNARGQATLTGIKNNLQWQKAWQAVHDHEGVMMIVPVAKEHHFANNRYKEVDNYVVFFVNRAEKVTSAQIFQVHAGSRFMPHSIPSIYNLEPKGLHGTYTTLSLFDIFYGESTYENDRLTKDRNMLTRPKSGTGRSADNCVDWFLVTTYYDPFTGEVLSQTEIYLGNSCSGCVPITGEAQTVITAEQDWECFAGSGGGPLMLEKNVNWVVDANATGGWHVKSYENLQGQRTPNSAALFTGITHSSSVVFNTAQPANPYYAQTYTELAKSVYLTGTNSVAVADVKGRVMHTDGTSKEVGNVKTWLAVNEFP